MEQVKPLPKPRNWFFWRSTLLDPNVVDMVNEPSKEKILRFQHEAAAAITGRQDAGDVYDVNDLKELGIDPGNSIESTHKVRGKIENKPAHIYFSCTQKKDIVQGAQDYNQEKGFFQRQFLQKGGQMAIPHKEGCIA